MVDKGGFNIDKKKKKILLLILLVLFVITSLSITYAWVIDSQKSKIESTEILISKTDELLISTDDDELTRSYKTTIDLKSTMSYVELKDLSGDGINLCSAIIDPYTKAPKSSGWNHAKVGSDSGITMSEEELSSLYELNKKNYYMFNVYFKSSIKLNVYLYEDSYVLPSDLNINSTDHDHEYCLFLKRTMYYDIESHEKTYTYETENKLIAYKISATDKDTLETSNELPYVYNRSLYSQDSFYDDLDTAAIIENNNSINTTLYDSSKVISNSQIIYSANYISSAIRVAFINEDAKHTIDYNTLTYTTDSVTKIRTYDSQYGSDTDTDDTYNKTKLRLIWAPNPNQILTKTYNANTDSTTYKFDITKEIEYYYDNDTVTKTLLGYSETYQSGDKYYYKAETSGDEITYNFLLYVTKEGIYKKLNGASFNQGVADDQAKISAYNTLKSGTHYTINNSQDIDSYRNNNQFYRYNGTTTYLSNVPDKLFKNKLTSTSDNLSNEQILVTLEKKDDEQMYTGKITVVMWLEGNDPDTSLAFASGNGAGCQNTSGISKFKYCLSFIGEMVEETTATTTP